NIQSLDDFYSSDEFLLEAGFLALLVAPLLPGRRKGSKGSPSDSISFWLVRWLLFRFLLTCGLWKLISGCPKWWSLSVLIAAFNYYFESLPLPSPLSWYFHHVPGWYLKLFGVITNVCQIGLPFLFFVPIRAVRITGFVIQILLQISVVLTGNYNFTNLLMVTLLLSLLDDQFFYGRRKPFTKWTLIEKVINILIYVGVLLAVIKLYSLKLNGTVIESGIAFSKDQFDYVLKQGLIITVYLGLISLGITILRALSVSLFEVQGSGTKILTVMSTIFYSGFAVLLFFASTVPLASLHSASNSTVHPSIRTVYNRLNKLHAVNQYGLFTKMVGVDGRPEIILEGSDNLDGPWLEYNFLYKPGNVNHSLPFVAPYSPRLDWQMFWAAYSTYDKQPWILSLTYRLLVGRPEVLVLLDRHHSPFTQNPPKYIRATLYKYKYSSWSQRSQPSWWVRQKVGEYFPAYTKDSPALVDYLKARNLLPTPTKHNVNSIWKQILDAVRYITGHLEATLLLWSVFTAGCAIITTSAKK
ncbi:lipase maturation factor 2, partial [Asbolus verrucosus]